MPGCALPIASYARISPRSRGQRRCILRVDTRTREGRLLRDVRKTLLEHVGSNPTAVHRALIESAAWLELRIALLVQRSQPYPVRSVPNFCAEVMYGT
jgi:hypothetical protein